MNQETVRADKTNSLSQWLHTLFALQNTDVLLIVQKSGTSYIELEQLRRIKFPAKKQQLNGQILDLLCSNVFQLHASPETATTTEPF